MRKSKEAQLLDQTAEAMLELSLKDQCNLLMLLLALFIVDAPHEMRKSILMNMAKHSLRLANAANEVLAAEGLTDAPPDLRH